VKRLLLAGPPGVGVRALYVARDGRGLLINGQLVLELEAEHARSIADDWTMLSVTDRRQWRLEVGDVPDLGTG
jgi:hypothetical protein